MPPTGVTYHKAMRRQPFEPRGEAMANPRRKKRDKNIVTIDGVSVVDAERFIAGYLERIGWAAEASDDGTAGRRVTCVTPENSILKLVLNLSPQAAIWFLSQQGRSVRIETKFMQVPSLKKRTRSLFDGMFFLMLLVGLVVFPLLGGTDIPFKVRDSALTTFIVLVSIALLLVWLYSTRFDDWDFMAGFYRHVYESTAKRAEILEVPWATNIRPVAAFMILGFLGIVLNRISFALASDPSDAQAAIPVAWLLDIPMTASILGILPLLKSGFSEKWVAHLVSITVGGYLTYYVLVPLVLAAVLQTGSNIVEVGLLAIVVIVFVLAVFSLIAFYVPLELERRHRAKSHAMYVDTTDSQGGESVLSLNYLVLGFWGLCALANILGVYFSLSVFEYLLIGRNQLFPLTQTGALTAAFGKPAMALYSFPMLAILMTLIFRWLNQLLRAMRAETPEWLEQDVARMAVDCGVSTPAIVVVDDIRADADTSRALPLGNVLTLTNTTLKVLTGDELRAVIAHELWHFRKHSSLFSFLDLLSRWSLFGKGFLTVMLNTKAMEYQADAHAVAYLVRAGMSQAAATQVLAKALETIVAHNEVAKYLTASQVRPTRVRMFYEIYFGDRIWWYAHPTIDERIRRLETLQ